MTFNEAEVVLGVDKNFYPYSETYLKTMYNKSLKLHFPNGIINISSIKFKNLKEAYELLLQDSKNINIQTTKPNNSRIIFQLSKKEELFLARYILSIDNTKLTDRLTNVVDTYYFCLCFLMPEDIFLQRVDDFGGIDNVLSRVDYQKNLANEFGVSLNEFYIRLAEFYLFNSSDNEELKMRRQEIKTRIRENMMF